MNEAKLLSTMASSRETISKIAPYVDANTFSDLGQSIYKEILNYYELDQTATHADLELIKDKLAQKYPKRLELFNEYLESLPEATSLSNLHALFIAHRKERLGLEIAQALASNKEDKAKKLMDEFITLGLTEQEEDEVFNAVPLSELQKHYEGKNLIPIYPTKLNQLLGGGVTRQTQICIFARPDVGKTVTAINLAGGAAKNGYKVLYVGNEDPAPDMVYRLVARLLGKPVYQIKENPELYFQEALQNGYQNLWFVPMHPGTLEDVRAWVEKVKPDVVVIDQIRNFAIHENKVQNLENGCIGMRNLAKEFNFVSVIVTQAGDSAHNQLVLDYTDVEWSNTGVAGAMDLMIGVGQDQQFKTEGKVMLSFPKNKKTAPIKPFHVKVDYETNRLLA